jgi:hypothetical protein
MHTEDLVLYDCSDRKVVEEVSVELPDSGATKFPLTFSVEAVDLGDLSCLMIASEQGDSLRVPKFEEHQIGDGLDAECTFIEIDDCCQILPRST